MGILKHYFFLWKTFKIYIKRWNGQVNALMMDTSKSFFSSSPRTCWQAAVISFFYVGHILGETGKHFFINNSLFVGWLVCCLLAGPDLWKRMPLKCSITMDFTCLLLSWCTISSLFRENNNVVLFLFPIHIFMPLANLWCIRLQG